MKILILIVAAIFILASGEVTEAQKATNTTPRIGFIFSTGAPESPNPWYEAFRQRLRELEYIEGKNILIERRYAEGRLDRMPALANELVQQKVDVIVAVNNVLIRAAREATKTIPIVMLSSVDPVAVGYVNSYAHPGGNITGLAWLGRELSAKRVELLRDVLPKMSRVAVLWDADGPGPMIAVKEYEAAARAFKLEFRSLEVRGPSPNLTAAFHSANTARVDALIVVGNALIFQHGKQLFDHATKNRIPTMTEEARYVNAGGLMSYGANFVDLYSRAAEYVVDILKGAKPGDLPVKLASRFEIVINLKTSQQIGLVVPQHLLVQADKVIK